MEDLSFVNILVNWSLAIIMLGIGLSLTVKDFKNIFISPKPLLVAFGSHMIVLPILALAITSFSGLPPEMKVGIVIIAACPVGVSSSLIVHLFKGNVALSISLAVVNSIMVPFSAPLVVNLALRLYLGKETDIVLPFVDTIIQIFIHVVIPAALGVLIRHWKANFAIKLEKPLKVILPLILAVVFFIKIFYGDGRETQTALQFSEFLFISPFVLMLNIAGMYIGYYLAYKKFGFNNATNVTIAIEVGLQNTALALMIAGSILHNSTMEKPILVYALLTFFTAVAFAWYFTDKTRLGWGKKGNKQE